MSGMMTAAELAEFRAWLNRRAPYSPDDEEFLPVRVTSLYGLLATVDALTERAERAEGELAEARKQLAQRDAFITASLGGNTLGIDLSNLTEKHGEFAFEEADKTEIALADALVRAERAEIRVRELEEVIKCDKGANNDGAV